MKCEKEQKEYAIISVQDRLIQTMKTRSVNDLVPLITDGVVLIECTADTGFNPAYKSYVVKGEIIEYRRNKYKGKEDIEFLRGNEDFYNKCFFGFSIIQHNDWS